MSQSLRESLTEAELEALLTAAKQPPTENSRFKDVSSLDSWIIAMNISTGLERVIPTRAYVCYRRWAKNPIAPNEFFRQFKKKFKQRKATRSKDGRAARFIYLLNSEPFLTIPKSYDELKAELRSIERDIYEGKDGSRKIESNDF